MKKSILNNIRCDDKDCFENDYFIQSLLGDISHASYSCLAIEQNPNFIFLFDSIFEQIVPDTILEIGTYHGGTTKAIRDIAIQYNKDVKIHTFDHTEPSNLVRHTDLDNILIYVQNLFSNSYDSFLDEYSEELANQIIQNQGTTYVLCDGGCKACEFRLLSNKLKKGDVIMLHDYSESLDYFNSQIKNKYWNWLEVSLKDIIGSCEANNLRPITRFQTHKAGWGCFQKH